MNLLNEEKKLICSFWHLGKSEKVEIIRIFRKQIKNIFELAGVTNILFLAIYCIMIAYYTKI